MHPKWTIFFVSTFVVLTILSGILEMNYFGSNNQGTILTLINTMQSLQWTNIVTIALSAIKALGVIILLLINVLFWNYSFFAGEWQIIRYAFFLPISVGFVISIVMAVRGTSSG